MGSTWTGTIHSVTQDATAQVSLAMMIEDSSGNIIGALIDGNVSPGLADEPMGAGTITGSVHNNVVKIIAKGGCGPPRYAHLGWQPGQPPEQPGRFEEALTFAEDTLAGRRRVLGEDTDTRTSAHNLAISLRNLGRYEDPRAWTRNSNTTQESGRSGHRYKRSDIRHLAR